MAQPGTPPDAPSAGAPPSSPPSAPVYGPPLYPPYYYPPPPARSTGLPLIIVVVAVVFALSTILPAILYFMVSGLIAGPDGAHPVVGFGAPTLSGDTVSFRVNSASQAVSWTNYRANLLVNATGGVPQPLSSGFGIIVGGDTYQVVYDDAGGGGTLNAGDEFRITHVGGFPAPTSGTYEFLLLWGDDSVVGFLLWP